MSFAWRLVLLLGLAIVPLAARAVLRGLRLRAAQLRAFGEPAVLARGSRLGDERQQHHRGIEAHGRLRRRVAPSSAPAARRARPGASR